jgi:hypothetical protein
MFYTVLILTGLIGFVNGWLLYHTNRKIWKKKYIKISAILLPFMMISFSILWWLGTNQSMWTVRMIGAAGSSFSFVLNLLLLVTLPFSLGIKGISNIISRAEIKETLPEPSRRLMLKTASAALPLFALGMAGSGFSSAFSRTRFPQVEMFFPGLPDALDGFKILQLTDLHLGYYFGLDHLENTLSDAEYFDVDTAVVIGDIADDLRLMTDAMKLIGQLRTPYQKYATLGNHEYFQGINNSIKKIEAGPVPLLINATDEILVNGSKIIVGGADDPVRLRGNKNQFFIEALNATYKNVPDDTFRLLLSHRPNAFNLAGDYKINLTLSGHTHGGQVGFAGKSLWDVFSDNAYLWGLYENGQSKLYTSAGMGHWFPFRLNCPLEAPVIILKKSV